MEHQADSPGGGRWLPETAASRRELLWAFAGVFVVAQLVYAPGLGNGFAWDDGYLIVENQAIHSFEHAGEWFTEPWGGGAESAHYQDQNALFWRPMTQASYALDWALGGGDPLVFHITNNLLHGLNCVLVALLAWLWVGRLRPAAGSSRLRLYAAGIAGLLFAVHPVHTEAVHLATYRTTLLAAFGVLSALAFAERPGRWSGVLSALCLAFGLMGKEGAIVMPALLVGLDIAFGRIRMPWRAAVARYAPVLVVAAVYLVLHAKLTRPGLHDFFALATPWETFCTMLKVYALDVRLMLVPYPLTPFYDWSVVPIVGTLADPEVVSGLLLLLLTAAGLVVALRARARAFSLCLGWFLVALLPYSHLMPFADAAGERFLYLASVAPCAAAGFGVTAAMARGYRPRLVLGLLASVLVVYSAMTLHRGPAFDSSLAMLEATSEVMPQSFNVQHSLGRAYLERGEHERAIARFRLADEVLPDFPTNIAWLAEALIRAQRPQEALAEIEACIRARGPDPALLEAREKALHAVSRLRP